ncbi:ras-associating and dilute domain-containing protein isoform X1 [Takifugu rubripes]|uniref:ras-associating and dilute domain-containing protein isoform X1 n=1 Tax=Takifugu rubripes TaxID=31033 RepID=UPI0011461097|nr:ras-associating and dilute domain-containing protein-like isoform X1 [Takifugu rubripes]
MNHMKISSEELRSLPPRPPLLPAVLPKRRFARLGRKTSDGSQNRSASSNSRSSDDVATRQPSKSRIHHHTNRLSGVFLRGPVSGSMALSAGVRPSLSSQDSKGNEGLRADDPSELSNHVTAPGILKIFGNEICEGAHYKSVLATTDSSARELVKEALERYGLSKKEAKSYVLCDTIGSTGNHQWRPEGFRVVGDNERPLLLQSLWKPREGLARRFEIQRKSWVEERTSKDKDTITAGINAQARKLQKSRSRVNSTLIQRTMGKSQKLWRSRSEMDILDSDTKQCYEQSKTNPKQSHVHSHKTLSEEDGVLQSKKETLCLMAEQEGEESEREETESSDDNTTQYSIHPPHDCPYLLLLQGYSPAQDFVIYLLAGPIISFGRQSEGEEGYKTDFHLFAADILPRHCCFHRLSNGSATTLQPGQGSLVMRNGEVLKTEVHLHPGDIISLGQHYLFLFKDPLALAKDGKYGPDRCLNVIPWMVNQPTSAFSTYQAGEINLCSTCTDLQASDGTLCQIQDLPLLKSPAGHIWSLQYESNDEDFIIKKIFAMGSSKDIPPLTAAFLLCLSIQHSTVSQHTSELRGLLLRIASGVQNAVWEHTRALAESHIDVGNDTSLQDLQALTWQEVYTGLRPLVVWMSNSLEILQFIQFQLPLMLECKTQKEEQCNGEERRDNETKNLALVESCVCSANEETVAALEEVIMLTFQQCVYYITKVLYPILPDFVDCNPFRERPTPQANVDTSLALERGGLEVLTEIRCIVDILSDTWRLLSDCQLHQEISSQLIGYLLFFINASLFNSLMEKGSKPGFYQWSRGVYMQANLDLLLDWAQSNGLEEMAVEHTHTLSSAINLLATPRKHLLQMSWVSLRSDYPALSPAQLNHLLSLYSPAPPCRHTWTPSVHEQASARSTVDILESFETQHPLVLPDSGYQFQLGQEVTDSALWLELEKLKKFISTLSQSGEVSTTQEQKDVEEFSICDSPLVSQKLQNPEMTRTSMDPSTLLTTPNTPQIVKQTHAVKTHQDKWGNDDSVTVWSSGEDLNDEGGLVFECLAALKVDMKTDFSGAKRLVDLKEEEQEENEEGFGDPFDDINDEVFSLELKRSESGLGLALIDTRDTSFRMKGIFIRAVVPDSPAARCGKLAPGDRILAVNGVSLVGLDYHSGKQLMQSSGDRLRLLVAKSDWMTEAAQTYC